MRPKFLGSESGERVDIHCRLGMSHFILGFIGAIGAPSDDWGQEITIMRRRAKSDPRQMHLFDPVLPMLPANNVEPAQRTYNMNAIPYVICEEHDDYRPSNEPCPGCAHDAGPWETN